MIERGQSSDKWVRSVLATSATMAAFLFVIRSYILAFRWRDLETPVQTLARAVLASTHDFLFVTVLTLVFLLALSLANGKPRTQRRLFWTYMVLVYLSFIVSLANVKIVKLIGSPFSVQWLYYADFLRGPDAQSAITHSLSWTLILVALSVTAAMRLGSGLLTRALGVVPGVISPQKALTLVVLVGMVYFPIARFLLQKRDFQYGLLEHPVTSFLVSVARAGEQPLLALETNMDTADFQIVAERRALQTLPRSNAVAGIQNVLVFVLESTPRRLVGARFGNQPVTPELDRLLPKSLSFTNVYAHVTATQKALVTILASSYPWISYRSLTREHPEIPMDSLAEEFQKRGYRTAMFISGDATYLGQDRFLAHRGFNLIQDFRTRACDKQYLEKGADGYSGASHEDCTADSVAGWIRDDSEMPFFALVWTHQTHYPYFASQPEIDFSVGDALFNRYLNALRQTDEALGKVVRELEKENLLDSTLLVVVGDHGETFGRDDGSVGHASHLYENNLRVPLAFMHPGLTGQQDREVLGGLIDVAPTIVSLLGWPLPARWQGRNLLEDAEPRRVYFFSPLSLTFGYWEGRKKFIYNARTDELQVYDLSKDPEELHDLGGDPDILPLAKRRLAAWVQYQSASNDRLISQITEPGPQD